MKTSFLLILIVMFAGSAFGQAQIITEREYDKAYDYAIAETNSQYPFVHTFTAEYFEKGEPAWNEISIAERQDRGVEKQTFTTVKNGKTTTTNQLRTGFGNNVYCSSDGTTWNGPQQYECPREIVVYRPPVANTTEYSVESKMIDGKAAKVYRKFETFTGYHRTPTYKEDIATIDPDGLFVSTIKTMGDLDTKSINTRLTNSWKLNAKFPKITAPQNAIPVSKDGQKGSKFTLRSNDPKIKP